MNPLFRIDFGRSDLLKSALIYETIIIAIEWDSFITFSTKFQLIFL